MSAQARTVYTVWTNTDLNEGRGQEFPLMLCETLSTARRNGKGRYVQGLDCRVEETSLVWIDNQWYGPVFVQPPSKEDIKEEAKQLAAKVAADAKLVAIDKARALGMTEEDIFTMVS